MKSVYYENTDGQWRFDLDDEEFEHIISSLLEEDLPPEEMVEECLEILRDIAALEEDEMDEDDQIDQSVSVAYLWHYFNNLAKPENRVDGDIAVIEGDDGVDVAVIPAADLIIEE